MSEARRQENSIPLAPDQDQSPNTAGENFTRRRLFTTAGKVTLGGLAFAKLPEANRAEATEFREGMSYIDGIKVAMKEAREGQREGGAIFVKMKGGKGAWYLPLDGTSKSTPRELGPLFERFGEDMKKGEVETIIHLHVHSLLTQENYDMGLTPALVREMKDGKRPFPPSPPSRNTEPGKASFHGDAVFMSAYRWKMFLKEYGMDSRYQFAEIAADCLGLWTYKLDESPNNPHNKLIKRVGPIFNDWQKMIRNNLKGFQRKERDEIYAKLRANDAEAVAKYIPPKDFPLHRQRTLIRQEEDEREARFVKVYWNFVQKSIERISPLKGKFGPGITNTPTEFDPKDYEELINAYAEAGFNVSFTSYKELGIE